METRKLFEARKYIAASIKMGHPLSDRVLSNWLNEIWPKKYKLGFYSDQIPDDKNPVQRKQFLNVLRKISSKESKLPHQCRNMIS